MTRGAGAGDGACWSTRDPRDRAAGRRGASRGGTRRGSTAVRVGAGWCVCVARSRSAQHQVRTPQALHAPAGGPPRRGSGCCCVHTLRPADAAASCPTRRVGGRAATWPSRVGDAPIRHRALGPGSLAVAASIRWRGPRQGRRPARLPQPWRQGPARLLAQSAEALHAAGRCSGCSCSCWGAVERKSAV